VNIGDVTGMDGAEVGADGVCGALSTGVDTSRASRSPSMASSPRLPVPASTGTAGPPVLRRVGLFFLRLVRPVDAVVVADVAPGKSQRSHLAREMKDR